MALASIALRPGLFRAGTVYQSKDRFYDADLVRWYSGAMQPIRGWRLRGEDLVVAGAPRAALTWRDNTGIPWLAVGTHSGLYALEAAGGVANITPTLYSSGRADAEASVGYGAGAYGMDAYGTPRQEMNSTGILPATMWTLDTWGENLIACAATDGVIYEWVPGSGVVAPPIANAPTGCAGAVVTAERILMALGAGGDPRRVDWSDQEDNTDWTPTATNQAGSFNLQTPGELRCGRQVRGGMLLLTTTDAWLANYLGPPFVYGFQRVGKECGVASPNAVVAADTVAAWMSKDSFWLYDGYVKPLPCEVHDAVFSDINTAQISKVYAMTQKKYGEVWWFYPSASSNEIDRAVIWNYRENHWTFAVVPRTCGDDGGVFELPLLVSPTGELYEHEVGSAYTDTPVVGDPVTYGPPYAEGGPIELGVGENTFLARKLFPDERAQGQVQVRFYAQFYPNGPTYEYGPYAADTPTNVRFTARQVRVRYEGVSGDWRVGNYRLEGHPGGTR